MRSLIPETKSMFALEAHQVSKVYRMYRRPIDRLKEALLRKPYHEAFESLKDVSLAVLSGSTLGIIGENGAGKSTLLKILAGTLTPTSGHVAARGRVSALLELGTGFHQEFTGRQNIHLNASLQGLSEREIREREPEIIEFAELGRFIDQPLKTYSSGMVMRLAFSTATSIDPDILIVDEALSVGDQHFQQKCVERMKGFRDQGKSIVFCSHSLFMVGELCEQALWLAQGQVRSRGKTSRVTADYLAFLEERGRREPAARPAAAAAEAPAVRILSVGPVDDSGRPLERVSRSDTLVLRIRTRRSGPPLKGHLGIGLLRPDDEMVFGTTTKKSGLAPLIFSGEQVSEFVVPGLPLLGGSFRALALVGDEHTLREIDQLQSPVFRVESEHPELGLVWLEHEWRVAGGDSGRTGSHGMTGMPTDSTLCLVVTHNGAATLPDLFRSLGGPAGDSAARPILVIDNASTDGTVELIQSLGRREIEVLSGNRNVGVARAFNLGLRRAAQAGIRWLHILDQDSRCGPRMTEQLLETALSSTAAAERVGAVAPSVRSRRFPEAGSPPLPLERARVRSP